MLSQRFLHSDKPKTANIYTEVIEKHLESEAAEILIGSSCITKVILVYSN